MAGAGEDAAAQAAKSAHAEVVGLAGAGGLMGRCMAASILAYGFRLVGVLACWRSQIGSECSALSRGSLRRLS